MLWSRERAGVLHRVRRGSRSDWEEVWVGRGGGLSGGLERLGSIGCMEWVTGFSVRESNHTGRREESGEGSNRNVLQKPVASLNQGWKEGIGRRAKAKIETNR